MLLAVGFFAYLRVGTGFLPRMDEGGFVLDYYTAPGTSLAETNRELAEVEGILKNDPYVYTYSRRTGAGLGGDLKEAYQGDFFVRLIDPAKRPTIWQVMDEINGKVASQVPGINVDIHHLMSDMIGDMVGRPQPVVVSLSAEDPGGARRRGDESGRCHLARCPASSPPRSTTASFPRAMRSISTSIRLPRQWKA